jgi:hypothetical protein
MTPSWICLAMLVSCWAVETMAKESTGAPLSAVCFMSDDAGLPEARSWRGDIGFAAVGFDYTGSIVRTCSSDILAQDLHVIITRCSAGLRFEVTTATLETTGIMLPYSWHQKHGTHLPRVHGFENGQLKNDKVASTVFTFAMLSQCQPSWEQYCMWSISSGDPI